MNSEQQARLKTTGRNEVCPCGSGRKYKKCHLTEDQKVQQAAHAVQVAAQAAAALLAKENESEAGADSTKGKNVANSSRKQERSSNSKVGTGKQASRSNNMPRRSAI